MDDIKDQKCENCGRPHMVIGGPCSEGPYCNCWVLNSNVISFEGGTVPVHTALNKIIILNNEIEELKEAFELVCGKGPVNLSYQKSKWFWFNSLKYEKAPNGEPYEWIYHGPFETPAKAALDALKTEKIIQPQIPDKKNK